MNQQQYRVWVCRAVPGILIALSLAGCGGISDLTRERVARSETVVKQAQQTLGTSESGAIELQRARDALDQAQRAVQEQDNERAQRLAHQAELAAELAIAKAQSASARKAAEELQASIRVLREEANRPAPGSAPPQN